MDISAELSPVVGLYYSLTCDVRVFGLSAAPEFTWTGPGDLPAPIRTSNFSSELRFSPLKLSNGGEYSCTVEVPGFPFTSRSVFTLMPNFLGKLLHTQPNEDYTFPSD